MTQIPVFIGGFRSGTTLLINLLGMHQEIAPWYETKSLCEALRWLKVLKTPERETLEADYIVPAEPASFSLEAVSARMRWHFRYTAARLSGEVGSGKADHEKYPLGFDCIGYSLQDAETALDQWRESLTQAPDYTSICVATNQLIHELGEIHRRSFKCPAWVNKTPEISRFGAELRDCLGRCKIIYLVRNGLDVVSSAHKLGWGEIETLANNWKALLEHTRLAMQDYPRHYLELHYEDLLARPAEVLNQVLNFSGMPLQGEEIVTRFKHDAGPDAFDLTRIGRESTLSTKEFDIFNSIAGELQAELGY